MSNPQILVFGGAFNPPTLAHEAIIAAGLGSSKFDEVWAMPSGDRPDKQMSVRDTDRLAMLEAVKEERFAANPRLIIADFEMRLPRPTQTYQTVEALEWAFPDATFWFAFGTDAYVSMPTWDYGEELQRKLNIVLFARAGKLARANYPVLRMEISDIYKEVSSTELRSLATRGKSLDGMVSGTIARYVHGHKLYAK